MLEVTASAPGKVILMGEHAAVYGRPAVVAAIGLRLRATLRELAPGDPLILALPDLSAEAETTWPEVFEYAREVRGRWRAYAESPSRESFRQLRSDDPAHLVKVALGEGLRAAGPGFPGPSRGARIEISSAIPVGSGFGSSAALAAAVLAVLEAWQGREISTSRLQGAALEIEPRSHGFPSGVDTTTVLAGGILFVERSGEELEANAVEALPGMLRRFALFDSGPPGEPTGSVVAEVRTLKEQAPHRVDGLLELMAGATLEFRRSLSETEADPGPAPSIKSFQRCLEDLGVVPREVQERVRQVEAAGGAAKISGAGSLSGPGAGSLLVYHPDPGSIARWPFLSDFRRFQVPLGDGGVRIEVSASSP